MPHTFRALDWMILALAATLMFVGLGSNSIQNEDEARYALAAQDMFASGNWIEPTVQGWPWWNKAPLRVWTNAALGSVFGFDLWVIRLPSAAAGVGAIAMMLALGRLWGGVAVGRWAALILTTSTFFLYNHGARTGEMESLVVLLWLTTLYAMTRARGDSRWALVAAVALGLVGMTKHVTYVLPVGGVLLLFAWRSKVLFTIGWRTWLLGVGIVLAIVLPWHVTMIARHPDFLSSYLGEQVVGRVQDHVANEGSRWFPLRTLKDSLFPWTLWIPFLLVARRRVDTAVRGVDTTLVVWIGGMLAVTAASRFDLPWYLLPAAPAVALWIARGLAAKELPVWAPIAASVLLLLSPTNVLDFDVIHTRAMWGGIGVQVLAALHGVAVWWVQGAAAVLALIILVAPRNVPAKRRIVWAVVTWGLFASIHAAMPLRHVFEPSAMAEMVDTVQRHRAPVIVLREPETSASDLLVYELRRDGVDHEVVARDDSTLVDRVGTAWIIAPFETLVAFRKPELAMIWSEYAAIAPRLEPPHTIPRDP